MNNLSKPSIVLVKDSKGNDLRTHPLIDLKYERGLHITQDLNAENILGKDSLEIFKKIYVS